MGSRKRIYRGLLVGGLYLIAILTINAQPIKLNNIERSDTAYHFKSIVLPYANHIGVTDSFGVQRYMHLDSLMTLVPIGSDSVEFQPDTVCITQMGTEYCVSLDSIYYTDTTLCWIILPDTFCISWSSSNGNIYNMNGALTANRTLTLNDKYLRFIQSGTLNGFQILPLSSTRMTAIQLDANTANSRGVQQAALEIGNTAVTSTERNAYIRYLNGTNIYAMGQDQSTPQGFTFSDSTNLKNPVWKYYSAGPSGGTAGDSLVFWKRTKFRSTLLDKDGDAGTSGEVLSSTATGIDWITAGGGGAISDLTAATATNDIDNVAYQQDWRWNSLAAGSGLKLSSSSTLASGDSQRLLESSLTGANANSGETTTSGYFSNLHTGSSSTNYGLYGIAADATTNYGLYGTVTNGAIGSAGIRGFAASNYGVSGVSTSSTGVFGSSSSSIGVDGASTTGTGVLARATTSTALPLSITDSGGATNTVEVMVSISHDLTGTAANGSGSSIEWNNETSTSASRLSTALTSYWTDATDATRTSQFKISGVSSATTNDILYLEGDKRTRFNGRSEMQQGADVASVAGAIVLGYDGNVFEITGTNTITLISNLGFQNGTEVTLIFTSTATLNDGQANSGTDIGMELNGNANLVASADDTITLLLCEIGGTQRWREKSRSIN